MSCLVFKPSCFFLVLQQTSNWGSQKNRNTDLFWLWNSNRWRKANSPWKIQKTSKLQVLKSLTKGFLFYSLPLDFWRDVRKPNGVSLTSNTNVVTKICPAFPKQTLYAHSWPSLRKKSENFRKKEFNQRLTSVCGVRLTPDDADADVELHDVVAEGGADHPDGTQKPAQDHDGTAAVRVHQNTADGTWNTHPKPVEVQIHETQNNTSSLLITQAHYTHTHTHVSLG